MTSLENARLIDVAWEDKKYPYDDRHASCNCKPGNLLLIFSIKRGENGDKDQGSYMIRSEGEDIDLPYIEVLECPPSQHMDTGESAYVDMHFQDKITERELRVRREDDPSEFQTLPVAYIIGRGRHGKEKSCYPVFKSE